MAHLSGVLLIDCPASALNNSGAQRALPMSKPERDYDNWSTVKYFRAKAGYFPYVSAQAFRYWLRESLKTVEGWIPSPIYREKKIAYTDGDPINYAEDDLFGYMRAPSGEKDIEEDLVKQGMTPLSQGVTLTRLSPFKVSTLISVAPLPELAFDYGTMSRGEGNPVPYVHEFYRTTLVGLFSIDLRMMGRFYHLERTGFRHLDEIRKKLAEDRGLAPYDNGKAFELDSQTRSARLNQLLEGLSRITGGAKQALHYTDVAPKLLFLTVAKGGNHLFGTAIGHKPDGTPKIQCDALSEVRRVFADDFLSPIYAGLAKGYLDEQREGVAAAIERELVHPVEAIRQLSADLDSRTAEWLA